MSEEDLNKQDLNTHETESQQLFKEGIPEYVEGAAIPSSPDDLSAEDRDNEVSDFKDETGHENYDTMDARESQIEMGAHSHIKGWGIDADPANDPTYPIKSRTNEEQLGNTWERPTLQQGSTEILMSNERNNKPAIFSSKNPPKGISGAIKRQAFKYSESDYKHWLLLVASDKIGVLEGKIDDLRHGHIPNPIAERGLMWEWKNNRKEFVKKTAVKTLVTGAAIGLILLSRKKKSGSEKVAKGLLKTVR